MTWAMDQRQTFIADAIRRKGTLNRSDIESEFFVTAAIASSDIQRFLAQYPKFMHYDSSRKCYVRTIIG